MENYAYQCGKLQVLPVKFGICKIYRSFTGTRKCIFSTKFLMNKYWWQYFLILNVTSISLTKSFNLEIDDKKKILPENILINISHPNFF